IEEGNNEWSPGRDKSMAVGEASGSAIASDVVNQVPPINEGYSRFFPVKPPLTQAEAEATLDELYPKLAARCSDNITGDDGHQSQLLFLVRHGETDENAAGRMQGRGVDASINSVGESQADSLGRFLRNVPFDTATCSTLKRTNQTATRILRQNIAQKRVGKAGQGEAEGAGHVPILEHDQGVDELSWGELEGKDSLNQPWSGMLTDLKDGWTSGDLDRKAKAGESPNEVLVRATQAVTSIVDKGRRVNLIVSHGR
ncbi:unnamed protein product, partial [Discosporangium mesarthrocarpum]